MKEIPILSRKKSHKFTTSLNFWAPASFASYGFWLSYNIYESRIVQNIITEFVDSLGYRTITRPENMAGGDNFNASGWTNIPIVKTVLTMNIRGGFRFGNATTLINGIGNETSTLGYSGGLGFNLSPGSKLQLSVNGNFSFSNVNYSIQSQHDQKIENHSASATIRYQFIAKTFFESNFRYDLYRNDRFGFDEAIPLWKRLREKNLRKEQTVWRHDWLHSTYSTNDWVSLKPAHRTMFCILPQTPWHGITC
jgi:hypothetical protein